MASCSQEVYIAIAKMGGMTWLANRQAACLANPLELAVCDGEDHLSI
jgi:hypothetical protein